MKRTKVLFSILLATIFLAAQVIAVGAAPANQDTTPITGTVDTITLETDATTGTTTVIVMLTDEFGASQTVRLSVEYALELGLVLDEATVNPDAVGASTVIDPTLVIPDASEETPEEQHPVGSALSDFFTDLLGVNYEMIMDYHEDGVGFGVIAQALWMTNALTSDDEFATELTSDQLFAAILDAKQDKDFSAITLPDGSEPTNWGQFRKAIMSNRDKAKENLGAIMSGRADPSEYGDEVPSEELQTEVQALGNGNGNNGVGPNNDKGNNGKNNGNNKDKNKDKGNGKGKNK